MTSSSGYDLTPPTPEEFELLAASLNPEERRVLLHQGTEPAFCGGLLANKEAGEYQCRLCDLPLFRSGAKFESGTGWPSFTQPLSQDSVATREDSSYGMVRTEVLCARCDGHLGHVFPDGPPPTGLRYCMNSVAMRHVREGDPLELVKK